MEIEIVDESATAASGESVAGIVQCRLTITIVRRA
jgi:hypothetical protein